MRTPPPSVSHCELRRRCVVTIERAVPRGGGPCTGAKAAAAPRYHMVRVPRRFIVGGFGFAFLKNIMCELRAWSRRRDWLANREAAMWPQKVGNHAAPVAVVVDFFWSSGGGAVRRSRNCWAGRLRAPCAAGLGECGGEAEGAGARAGAARALRFPRQPRSPVAGRRRSCSACFRRGLFQN
ncbi:uncharacterized protein Tco025E_08361 [Trypanosoma conorhini]|uniref:Uncharacterized protein n=1 Tax=Trypanosoma conorhini TaxID=83891 RepID=A0A3R7NHJ1_9TRYP|nr:uncharacterized protein Tco025E_08361 [Trypanosoma conorhini]RNF02759.1 hypothetical protein Tco025E_08361 [Trypanosoma conorhini]